MRFNSQSTVNQIVQWYFVPDDTPVLPHLTSFSPRNWDLKQWVESDLGEVKSPRPYSKGPAPYPIRTGEGCGSAEQWLGGFPDGAPSPDLWPGSLVPTCCPRPSLRPGPGSVWTRTWSEPSGLAPPNLCCGSVDLSLVVTLRAVNVTSGPFPRPVGLIMRWVPGLGQWEYGSGGTTIVLKCNAGAWQLSTNCLLGPNPDGSYPPDYRTCTPFLLRFNAVNMGAGIFNGQFLQCSDAVSVEVQD